MGTECNCLKDDKEDEFRIGSDVYSFKKMVSHRNIKILNFIKTLFII